MTPAAVSERSTSFDPNLLGEQGNTAPRDVVAPVETPETPVQGPGCDPAIWPMGPSSAAFDLVVVLLGLGVAMTLARLAIDLGHVLIG